ncbi:iron-sulfur cluster biosynthesis protein [Vagococcus sp. DIV0080]|uniref:Iron-sulfur cluster biosynthesis protein n=1 Tax=Candidatus Vagococcus giribetii TaxID=2230876 RepID=A0ABS3HVW4_9ENTE|nr:iron-sulfur cluster biosynthesis protein [Vagococcus sp. DIV0080]MBO0477898.1 iron-sulfur cluster biosynthesis protein [Vagococcus sp. DIV0080]
MELTITPEALAWFKEELLLEKGDSVRIFGKYGGATNVHVGFSTGIEVTTPHQESLSKEFEGIRFFTEQGDDWFFSDYDLTVSLNDVTKEPTYTYN